MTVDRLAGSSTVASSRRKEGYDHTGFEVSAPAIVAFAAVLAVVALVIPLSITSSAGAHDANGNGPKPTIVLVHGDWADGSSWSAVISRQQGQGYPVVAPPNPLRGPTEDDPYLASYLQTIPGPIILVGHSYGGFVITNAVTGIANMKALVYIDAFIPDANQTLAELSSPESCLDRAAAGRRGATGRTVRAAGVGEHPVVIVDRNPGPRGAAVASRRRCRLMPVRTSPSSKPVTSR